MRKLAEMLIVIIYTLCYLYRRFLLFLQRTTCSHMFLHFSVNFHLIERFKPLKDKLFSDWIRQPEQN